MSPGRRVLFYFAEPATSETAVDVVTEIAIDVTHPTGRIVYTCQVAGDEICIMRTDGRDVRRLTDNQYCDYQPRWGK